MGCNLNYYYQRRWLFVLICPFSPQVLIPLFTGQPLPSEKLQEVMEGLSTSLKQFEERFLQDKAFIIGSEISLADLVAIVELMQVSAEAC